MTFLPACSLFRRSPEDIEKANRKYQKIVEDKACLYDIDPEGVTVEEGGEYFKVPMDPMFDVEQMEDYIVNCRKWLRFAYNELGKRYFVAFVDRNHPDIMYGGFSDQDLGFPSEYYWDDLHIANHYVSRIDQYTSPDYKKNKRTPEEFYELTGISEETAEEFHRWFYDTFYTRPSYTPDKNEHDITFIPGDNIQHYEKFVVGGKDCDIKPGTYLIDIPGRYGLIHITSADGTDKCRLYAEYYDGHSDSMYEYSAMPAEVELEKGDIIYMTNCASTFDRI